MSLRDRYDAEELELLPKHLHSVLCTEEDTKFILNPPLHSLPDEARNFWGT